MNVNHTVQKFKIIMCIVLCVTFGGAIFIVPETVKNGVISGMILCFRVVIPSLFPFAVLSYFVDSSLCGKKFPTFAERVTQVIFGLSVRETEIFLMSMISGYPMGSRLVSQLYKDGLISEKRAQILLGFCVNGGPSFIIIAVGTGMFGYRKAGIILFLSHIAASFIICRISTALNKEKSVPQNFKSNSAAISDRFVDSVANASNSMLSICACVVLFSAICSIIKILPLNSEIKTYVSCLAEVTSGLSDYSLSIPMTAFFLGFSGFSVHLQVLSAAGAFSPSIPRFICVRFIHGALSYIICKVFLTLSPIATETLSNSVKFISGKSDVSIAAAVSLVATIFITGFYLSSVKRLD